MKKNLLSTLWFGVLSGIAFYLPGAGAEDLTRDDYKRELQPLPADTGSSSGGFELPPVEIPKDRLSALPMLYVNAIHLEGNTVYTTELDAITAEYTNREISAEELQELRYKLTKHYVDDGYINSGAIIPDQEVKDGNITIKIIEGKLTDLDISENKYLRDGYLRGRISREGEILNTKVLQERLQILQQSFLVDRFNAELGPGLRPGEAVLKFIVTERERPYEFGFEFNNHRSPSVGSYRTTIDAKHHSLTGWGDTLYARYGLTEGLKDYLLEYTIPVTPRDTMVNFRIENSDSEVVTEPFTELDVESEAETYSMGVRHPFYRRYTEDFHYKVLELGLSLEKRSSNTSLLGRPFSFSPGVQNGESKLTVLRFSQNWLDRSREQVVAFYSSFGAGLDMWDATINDGLDEEGNDIVEPDGKFFTWIGQFRWIRRLPPLFNEKLKNTQLWFRADAQWANEDLLPLEKFAVGGVNTVRGYRENQLTRDRGLVLSLEWQIPLNKSNTLMFTPFVDYGWGENVDLETPDPSAIYSVGLGFQWNPKAWIQTELYWGHALEDVEKTEDDDIQDDGIHFSLRLQY